MRSPRRRVVVPATYATREKAGALSGEASVAQRFFAFPPLKSSRQSSASISTSKLPGGAPYALPRAIPFGVGHVFDLIEPRHRVADVPRVGKRLFSFSSGRRTSFH